MIPTSSGRPKSKTRKSPRRTKPNRGEGASSSPPTERGSAFRIRAPISAAAAITATCCQPPGKTSSVIAAAIAMETARSVGASPGSMATTACATSARAASWRPDSRVEVSRARGAKPVGKQHQKQRRGQGECEPGRKRPAKAGAAEGAAQCQPAKMPGRAETGKAPPVRHPQVRRTSQCRLSTKADRK